MIDKNKIIENFSKYAKYYDMYCNIQRLSAKKLIRCIDNDGLGKILDIGCGTGNYTKILRDKFPFAQIKAIDISKEMVEIAKEKLKDKKIEFAVSDGERLKRNGRYELITSNVCFQWFEDLGKALVLYNDLLSKNGCVLFSIFGPLTFKELHCSLRDLLGDDMSISSNSFKDKESIKNIIQKVFSDVMVEEEIYKEKYNSLSRLLESIRYTGSKGNGLKRRPFWTPNMIARLESVYRKKFNDITATYQLFFCKGIK